MLTDSETIDAPDWWLLRLGQRLEQRKDDLRLWRRYYRGDHPLPEGPKKATAAFRDFQRSSRTNFCSTVVDASVDRLRVLGVTDDQGTPDTAAWSWWQANKLDARQVQVYRTALSLSEAYAIVGPHPREGMPPLITPEHPRQVIVDVDPATGQRRAALKAWFDDIEKVGRANLWLPGKVFKYVTEPRSDGPLPWGPRVWSFLSDAPSTSEVPVVPFACRPDLAEDPLPEFGGILDIQDRVNFGVLNRMTAERYGAFRQRYVVGHKFRRRTDPMTGLEVIEQPFTPDPAGMFASEGTDTRFGEFSQTALMDYLKSHEMDIRDLLVVSRTPAYYYAGDLINIGADTVNALDMLHVAKVGEHQANFGEAWEDVLQLAAEVAGAPRDLTAAEVRWRDAREFNPAVVADQAVKLRSIGYPLAVVAEKVGESPQMVARITSESAADALLAATTARLTSTSGNPPPAFGAPSGAAGSAGS